MLYVSTALPPWDFPRLRMFPLCLSHSKPWRKNGWSSGLCTYRNSACYMVSSISCQETTFSSHPLCISASKYFKMITITVKVYLAQMKDTSLCFAGMNTGVTHVSGGWWVKLHSSTCSAYTCENMYVHRTTHTCHRSPIIPEELQIALPGVLAEVIQNCRSYIFYR